MKKALPIITVLLLSLSACSCQSKVKSEFKIIGKDTVYVMDLGKMDETQMYKLYQLLQAGKLGMSTANNLSAYDVTKVYYPFADSLLNVLQTQSDKWHPKAVPPKTEVPLVPKADTSKKK